MCEKRQQGQRASVPWYHRVAVAPAPLLHRLDDDDDDDDDDAHALHPKRLRALVARRRFDCLPHRIAAVCVSFDYTRVQPKRNQSLPIWQCAHPSCDFSYPFCDNYTAPVVS